MTESRTTIAPLLCQDLSDNDRSLSTRTKATAAAATTATTMAATTATTSGTMPTFSATTMLTAFVETSSGVRFDE